MVAQLAKLLAPLMAKGGGSALGQGGTKGLLTATAIDEAQAAKLKPATGVEYIGSQFLSTDKDHRQQAVEQRKAGAGRQQKADQPQAAPRQPSLLDSLTNVAAGFGGAQADTEAPKKERGKMLGGFGDDLGGLAGAAVGGPIGMAVGTALGKIAEAAIDLPGLISDWGDSLKDSQKGLMAFNGVIAGAMMESERRGMLRKVESGAATEGSTRFLTEGLDDLKDELRPWGDALTNISNLVVGHLTKLTKYVVETAGVVVTGIQAMVWWINWDKAKRDETKSHGFVQFMRDVGAGGLSSPPVEKKRR